MPIYLAPAIEIAAIMAGRINRISAVQNVDRRWMTCGGLVRSKPRPIAANFAQALDAQEIAGHTQLKLLTKSYESRSLHNLKGLCQQYVRRVCSGLGTCA